jgi:hypothetical protein
MKIKALIIILLLAQIIFISGCKDDSTNPSETSSRMSKVGQYNTPDYAYDVSIMPITGLDYAFIADGQSGLQIVNVTNPSNPNFISNYNTSGTAVAVFTAQISSSYYAFLSDGLQGLSIINVSTPNAPEHDTTLYFQNDRVLTSFVDAPNGTLYIGTYYGNIYIYNISALPDPVSQISAYTSPLDNITGIYVTNGLAYVSERSIGMEIINVSNPSNPQNVSNYDTPGYAYDVAVGGNYAFVADGTSLYIINVTNPFNPVYAGNFSTQNATYFGIALNYPYQAFTADYEFGVETFSTTVPGSPNQLGYYNTDGFAINLAFFDGYVFTADGSDGLIILRYQ